METTTVTAAKHSPKFGISSACFLVAVLLFLLPFVNIRCGQNVISNNGIGLAFGVHYKTTKQVEFSEDDKNNKLSVIDKDSGKMYVSALIAFLLGIAGIVLSAIKPGMNKINAAIAVIAALGLIALMIQIRYDFKNQSGHVTGPVTTDSKWTIEFTAWYYLSLISFMAAAFFSYWRKRIIISS